MKITWKRLFAGVVTLAAAGLIVAWSGIIHIRASTGHWRVTDWFLHWVMRSSVRTAALGVQPPAFTPGMLTLAAGHYETGCAGCHGSPAMPRPVAVQNMLPPPPDLKAVVSTWSDAQLYEIVRHGIRYTGMPAWPAVERDDEVWAMVAFLRAYPKLDQATYRRLAGFSATQSQDFSQVVTTCAGCHSPTRLYDESLIPHLAGQSETYLRNSLAAYAAGKRPSGVMAAALSRLSNVDRERLARHFANEKTSTPTGVVSKAGGRGETLAQHGDKARGLAACAACHDTADANQAYPRLAGQPAAYLESQLHLFRAGIRGGGDYAPIMTRVASGLTDDDIRALADYYSAISMD
ncbi:c-type cytochrome [Pararhizobium sp. O133]|uniref:c-type cytochrome n=1 Tax=Pararhizobium sp. O133 TaxID=3449278 RepID=UPI003F6895B6